jgi:hypothetical protein
MTSGALASLTSAIGLALTRGTELSTMLQQCTEALVKHLDGGLARIWTLNDTERMLELQASAGTYTQLDGPQAKGSDWRAVGGHDRARADTAVVAC